MANAMLTNSQVFLLRWLSKEDFSQHGECKGADLDVLMAAGLVEWATFERADQPRGGDFRWVQVTDAGYAALHEQEPGND